MEMHTWVDSVGLWAAAALLPLSLGGALALSLLALLDVDRRTGAGRSRQGDGHAP